MTKLNFGVAPPRFGQVKSRLLLVIVVLATASLFAGCSRPTPVALLFNAAPWQDGETHTFRVTDVDGNRAGSASYTITAGSADDGKAIWSLQRNIQTQGDNETVTTKVSATGFRPTASYLERSNAAGTETVDAQYNGPAVDMLLTTRAAVTTNQRAEVPSDVRDTTTLPMIVRALPLTRGYATQLNTFLPVAAVLDRVTVSVVGDEEVTVPAGVYDAWVVTLDTGDATSRLWIAKAAPYPLVKYIDGRNKATFELERYVASQ
ncbi:MAG TPA: hypothetical protein DCL15_10585 [Chloroflexi bacterium]|nr:hypothetical protein [Chloroflexota bacterium]HHW87345.1 DUF3108 domain-containing protein [Chloroflexota bacterium]